MSQWLYQRGVKGEDKMGAIDLTDVYKKYKGKWVALAKDEQTVLSSGKTASVAYKKAKAKGFEKPILMKIPREIVPYIG
ncbi:MAG: DUF5678 domain-containing protein [Actinomycetota bacterium]|nr:DUF5678 domain-containing protein [Actinomycetota bacterium]MDI6821658.1 DUF5678 domain-containing protein [Actinomycetota bacterium]